MDTYTRSYPDSDLQDPHALEQAYLAVTAPARIGPRLIFWTTIALVGLMGFVLLGALAATGGNRGQGAPGGCVAGLSPTPNLPPGSAPAGVGVTPEQQANANTIVSTGRGMGVPDRGLWVALAAALQESQLRNINYGDRDSLGLFQQRPSQGWGTEAQVTDPVYASTQFFARLLNVPGWESMPLAQAAQAVQRSAFPDAYAKWADKAARILAAAGGQAPAPCAPPAGGGPAAEQVDAVLTAGRAQLGKPYRWGATGPDAFDCSGLVQAAWKSAGVTLPRTSRQQASSGGARVPLDQMQPGDLLFWSSTGSVSGVHHVALWVGEGQILEAPESGRPVRVRPVRLPSAAGPGETELLPFAVRPGTAPNAL